MMYDEPLSSAQVTAVLDNAPVGVYVSALGTWKLLYANRLVKQFFLDKPDILESQTMTCYQAAGFAAPCPYCQINKMEDADFFVREFYHQKNKRTYQLSGKLMDWDGQPAHIEYILDITEKRREEDRSKAMKRELENTFSSIPCGLSVYHFDGKQISPVIHNPAFYEIMGYSDRHISQIRQETNFLGVHPEDLPRLQETVEETLEKNGVLTCTYRVFNDRENSYRWIRLDGSVKPQDDGTKLIYGVHSDVTGQVQLEKELGAANDKMQDIINAIPGGVAIYKVSDIFQTVYFSDGVPELSGYTVEEYQERIKGDATEMIYSGDRVMVVDNVQKAIEKKCTADFEFRKVHRDGHLVWVRVQAKQIGEEDGYPLIHCVFHNISALKETQLEMAHLINSIPGGIAIYQIAENRFKPDFFSDGVMAITGHTREEYEQLVSNDVSDIIYEQDKARVASATKVALESGEPLDIFYRVFHKDGRLIWIHLNGRCMGPLTEKAKFYAIFTGMSSEARIFQSIANETADGIYVIGRENYELLYANESVDLFIGQQDCTGQKCYTALYGKDAPCEFCTLKTQKPEGLEHEMAVGYPDKFYSTKFHMTEWNGIPAYVKYVRDVTDEVRIRKEKERLEQYFQTMVKNLPGGVAVIRCAEDRHMVPEFLSDGFADMTEMTLEEAWDLYREDAMAGVHPDDQERIIKQMEEYLSIGEGRYEAVYRLVKGSGGYVWVKNMLTLMRDKDGELVLYDMYHDITTERQEQEQLRQRYKDLLVQHYRTPEPNSLIVGHCNITRSRILEIIDYTDSDLLTNFGSEREAFFTGISRLIVDEKERRQFLSIYLNKPALEAFRRGETEQKGQYFIKMPRESLGRYAQVRVNMVETPDTGDVTGILKITDVTEQVISDRILHQLSADSYDFITDVNLFEDTYTILSFNQNATDIPQLKGIHSQRIKQLLEAVVLPKDRERCAGALETRGMVARLEKEGSYSFAYATIDGKGDIRTKSTTVSAVDLRLGRICLARTDITNSVREQQGLLNAIAYTFELATFLELKSQRLSMHTRRTVLENLSPYMIENYNEAVGRFAHNYGEEGEQDTIKKELQMENMVRQLEEKPGGYDFLLSYRGKDSCLRYKQINVLWGDENHRTICVVRADITDMVTAERKAKKDLESALVLAEEANRAKSDFLSSMSHDIRTPMNGIMGMTALATANIGNQEKVSDCLEKITISSRHLLSLINDVLDMSKIERSRVTLNREKIGLQDLVQQMSAILTPQTEAGGLDFCIQIGEIQHPYFYGDLLRISQVLINILSNAVKFTPRGGSVYFDVKETGTAKGSQWARYQFTVRDTGIGMPEEFLAHIFEPFARSKDSKVERIEGTGLGLSIAKGLVNLMDGTIVGESTLNQGTVFTVQLELEAADPGNMPGQEETDSSSHSGSREEDKDIFAGRYFLVAEDNEINAEILCELLAMYQAGTVVKVNGRETVEAFSQAPQGTYDAILMDIQMPELDGYEATRVIRGLKRPDAKSIPIIAMTANAFSEDVRNALDAGMDAHVAKPIDLEILKDVLIKILKIKD